ncbi:MAG: hypothetical protein NPIRA02_29350 [Nitrospirales bacterium]|nr:MAG: hypothetical protein NPIRA02_29350 [Nitrospirales bacterium]
MTHDHLSRRMGAVSARICVPGLLDRGESVEPRADATQREALPIEYPHDPGGSVPDRWHPDIRLNRAIMTSIIEIARRVLHEQSRISNSERELYLAYAASHATPSEMSLIRYAIG